MNITDEQLEEILELLDYVGIETWGKTEIDLNKRTERLIEELLKKEKDNGSQN